MATALNEDWQGKKSLVECNRYMLENEIGDVTFKLVYIANGERSTPVHVQALKTLLLARSSVFYAMFCGALQEQGNVIEVTDVEPGAFKLLLKYCYTDEVDLTSDNILAVLYASTKYMISGLTELCDKYLDESLTSETAQTILDQSILSDVHHVVPKCMKKIQSDTSQVLASKAFTNLSPEAFHEVLKSETMNATELQVFNASMRWAENQCKLQGTKATVDNIRTTLGENLYLIRFPVMTVDEFNDNVDTKAILTDAEAYQVVKYITTKNKPKNLPFITRNRNHLKMEKATDDKNKQPKKKVASPQIVGEKKYILMDSPFQNMHVDYGDFLHTKLECTTSHTIQIHAVLVHAAHSWFHHDVSIEIGQGGTILWKYQDKDVVSETSWMGLHQHRICSSVFMHNVFVRKGKFEINIKLKMIAVGGRVESDIHLMKLTSPEATSMSQDNITIDINKLTGRNVLLGFRCSLY